ncbi:MAG: tRNA (guanosine(37)-N1)-methyltransferase TrmD [Patescibacteria group bacterium]|nr:tRNA (guanosine(37)-N1)-methyltransferase TrmD [Patescibacteria group bacterium]
MTFHIVTIFPEIFDSYLNEGILKRAQDENKIEIKVYNLRDFANDKHKTVDDTPYGGGPGMVLKVEPIYKCIEHVKSKNGKGGVKVILTSAKGKKYTQKKAESLKDYSDVIVICGRYEGVDERVAKYIADEEISIGEYVLTGGELPAMVIVDSVSRLLKDVLGNKESLKSESHKKSGQKDFPVYTRPEVFESWQVPNVLLSGNHEQINNWRIQKKK